MNKLSLRIISIVSASIISQPIINGEETFEFYLYQFQTKQNQAIKILEEVEIDLKNGSRHNVCKRQKNAAKLGIEANNSLIEAFKVNGTPPPLKSINITNKLWKEILTNCEGI